MGRIVNMVVNECFNLIVKFKQIKKKKSLKIIFISHTSIFISSRSMWKKKKSHFSGLNEKNIHFQILKRSFSQTYLIIWKTWHVSIKP